MNCACAVWCDAQDRVCVVDTRSRNLYQKLVQLVVWYKKLARVSVNLVQVFFLYKFLCFTKHLQIHCHSQTAVCDLWLVGFVLAIDKQRINAFFQCGRRSGLCPTDASTFEELSVSADQQLFEIILASPNHALYQLLPPISVASQSYTYILRPRAQNRQLTS